MGLRAAFHENARGDGRAFVERYVCLTVPLSLRLMVAYFGLAVLWNMLVRVVPQRIPLIEAGWPLLYLLLYVWFFTALRRAFRLIVDITGAGAVATAP